MKLMKLMKSKKFMKKSSLSIIMLGTLLASISLVRAQTQTSLPPSVIDLAHFAPYTANARDGNFSLSPPYTNAPELTSLDTVPKGAIYRFRMESTDSMIYPGIAKNQVGTVPYSRGVTVYVPSQYVPGKPAPFLVSQDSMGRGGASDDP